MAFRDEDRARAERLASLEARAAEADRLAEENHALRRRVERLETEVAAARPRVEATTPAPASGGPADRPPLPRELGSLVAEERWAEALELAGALVEQAGEDVEGQLVALRAMAWIGEVQLADPSVAEEALERALDLDPLDRWALHAWLRIAIESEDWMKSLALRERIVELAGSDGERIAQLLAIASVSEEELGDEHGARRALRRVLELDPSHDGARAALDRIGG